MNSIKQALNFFKSRPWHSLGIGVVACLAIWPLRHMPYISALLISTLLVGLQLSTLSLVKDSHFSKTKLQKKELLPFTTTILCLFPSTVLLGAAIGIAESPYERLTGLPIAWLLISAGLYFFFLFTHSLLLSLKDAIKMSKAIDKVANHSFKNFNAYFIVSFILSFAAVVASLIHGALYILIIPILLLTSVFLFQEQYTKKTHSQV